MVNSRIMETALSSGKVTALREGDIAHYRTPPHNNDAEDYGRTIHDLYLRRQLITIGEDVVNDAYRHDLDHPAESQIEQAEQHLFQLAESGQTEGGFQPFHAALADAIVVAEAAFKR